MLGARKVFELSGVVPLTVYVIVHVASYAGVLLGWQRFGVAPRDSAVLWVLELVLVALPLAFHSGYGLWLAASPLESEPGPRQRTLGLRLSGLGLLAFVAAHLTWLKWPLWVGERSPEDVQQMLIASLSATSHGIPLVALAHLAGLGLAALHLALGLPRFAESWGIGRELVVRRGATALSLVVFALGAATVVGLATGSALPRFLR